MFEVDDALVKLRRLWSSGRTTVTLDDGAPVEMSSILVVEACARRAELGEETAIGDVARFADTAHSTASRIVDRALAAGLVTRDAADDDARRMVVTLTPLGHRTRSAALAYRTAWLRDVVASWTDEDLKLLASALTRFAAEVEAHGPPHARLTTSKPPES